MIVVTELPTILIADDDPISLGIIAAMSKKIGYTVITAVDGVDAIELFGKNKESIGFVLLDINMPKMNGIVAFQNIRNLCHQVKVIIVSGCLNEVNCEQMSVLNPTAYIKKPFNFDHLSDALNPASFA